VHPSSGSNSPFRVAAFSQPENGGVSPFPIRLTILKKDCTYDLFVVYSSYELDTKPLKPPVNNSVLFETSMYLKTKI